MGVPDVAETGAFYRDFGLEEVTSGVFATLHGGQQLRLAHSRRRALLEIRLAVESVDDIDRICADLARLSIPVTRTASGVETKDYATGVPVRVEIEAPLVQQAEPATLFNGPGRHARLGRAPGVVDRSPARPRKLGHVVYGSPDLEASVRFHVEGLGFKVSDSIGKDAHFLRCSGDHHNLLIQRAPVPYLHHTAWEVADVDEIGRGARSLLDKDPARHAWGFGRHHVGSNFFWYFRDPAGNFSEYYSDLDVIVDDAAWRPEIWEGSRALVSWGPPPPPSFLVPDDLADLMVG